MYDKILALIQEHGPLLPVEVAGKTNMNSFLAKAYMEELVQQGKLAQGDKIGSTPIFMLPGQEKLASKRAEELLGAARTVATHVGKDLDMSSEAVEKRERFKKHFEKTLSEPDRSKTKLKSTTTSAKHTLDVSKSTPSARTIEPQKAPVETQLKKKEAQTNQLKERITKLFARKEVKSAPKQPQYKPTHADAVFTPARARSAPMKTKYVSKSKVSKLASVGEYVSRMRRMFESGKAKLIEEISEKKKKGKYVVDFPSSIGAVRYYVTVYDKRSINKSDIALAYTEAANRKLPALLLMNGKLASGAEEYAKELGGMLKWKVVK